MAKINQYPAKTVPSNNDEFVLHDPSSGSTKKMTRGDLIGGAPLPADSVTTAAIDEGAVTHPKIDFSTFPAPFKLGQTGSLNSVGTRTITGVGFRPKAIDFTYMQSGGTTAYYVNGSYDGSSHYSTSISVGSAARYGFSTTTGIRFINESGSGVTTFTVTGFTADGFTINITESNPGSGNWAYKAYR